MAKKKDCNCGSSPAPQSAAADAPSSEGVRTNADMVKVEYTGDTKSLYGAVTGAPYGYRSAGAVFNVWRQDLAVMGDLFNRVDEMVSA